MGVLANLSMTLVRHEDGCVIMSWRYEDSFINLGDQWEKVRFTTFADALVRLWRWIDLVEGGPVTSQELYEALQGPFDDLELG